MLKTFPKRKMMFVPQAKCKTAVPDTFKVLLSQRRRWINSTIHNLVKLVFVNDLCGTFCFSMQFVVFFELCGTVILPAALCFTLYICLSFIFSHSVEILPVILLFSILGLPGILIFITSRKWNYILWMLIYLFALPIWNFVLPLYAAWHMDDFSWGETRKITSTGNETTKKEEDSEIDITEEKDKDSRIPFKFWSEYEFERIYDSQPHLREHRRSSSLSSLSKVRNASSSTLNSSKANSIYSALISNYNHSGGSNSKINYHDLYQLSQNDLFGSERYSGILLEGIEAVSSDDLSEIKKFDSNYPYEFSPTTMNDLYDNRSLDNNKRSSQI